MRGSYSLLEPDGSTRIVDYIADHGGFRAVVKRINLHGYATVQSHGGEPAAPVVAGGLSPIIAADAPHVVPVQPEWVVRQQAIHAEPGPVFESYDGGIQNYQHLVPYQVQVPRAEGEYIEAQRHEIAYAPPTLIAPQAHGIIGQPEPQYIQERIPETYQAPISPVINEAVYRQPQHIYQSSLPAADYQTPIQRYEEPQIDHVALPAYRENIPIDNYRLEMSYGDTLGAHGNTVLHPHGHSSQAFSGRTGNVIADDRSYTDYNQPTNYEGRYKRNS